MKIELDIPDNKSDRITKALTSLYPKPTEVDKDGKIIEKYTDSQWCKELIRRWVIKQVARYEQQQAISNIKYNEEDDLI